MKVPISNDTDKFMHIGPVTIPPGDTRDVEETYLPNYRGATQNQETPPPDRLIEISAMSVKLIIAVLADLSDEDLARLLGLEQEDRARKGVLEGIAAEQLKRAANKSEKEATESANGSSDPQNAANGGTPPPAEVQNPLGGQE